MGYKLLKYISMYILNMYIYGNVMNINSLPATVICSVPQWDGSVMAVADLKNALVSEKNIEIFKWNIFLIKITQDITHIVLEKK